MGEGKSEGGPGVDRGGGRGCQLGPGLSSGSLFVPRVSLGAAGDNVALSGAAGGGGTRRTERYPPGPAPAGTGAFGAAGRASRETFPQGRGGGFLLASPLPLAPEGAPKDGRCPAWWLSQRQPWQVACAHHRGLWRHPQPGSPGGQPLPARRPPRVVCGTGGTPVALLPSSVPPPAPSVFPRRGLLSLAGSAAIHPRGTGDPGRLRLRAGTAHISGCRGQSRGSSREHPSPSAPPQAPLRQEREYSPSPASPPFCSPREREGGHGVLKPGRGCEPQHFGARPARPPLP